MTQIWCFESVYVIVFFEQKITNFWFSGFKKWRKKQRKMEYLEYISEKKQRKNRDKNLCFFYFGDFDFFQFYFNIILCNFNFKKYMEYSLVKMEPEKS